MSKANFLLIIACVALFSTLASAGDEGENKATAFTIHIWDYCDPATFGALCTRTDTSSGVITRPGFNFELNLDKSVGAWRFAPETVQTEQSSTLLLKNLGGETHTFTRVKKFGGGFVAPLNAASGNPVPAPECARVVNGNLVPQPPSENNIFLPAGTTATGPQVGDDQTEKFQCCIHPWMRLTITPKDHNRDNDPDQDK